MKTTATTRRAICRCGKRSTWPTAASAPTRSRSPPRFPGQTITLGGTELAISEALTIDARPLAANVTIDANELSRIFNITATTGDFTLGGLTLTGGRTTDQRFQTGRGGAIRSLTTGNLTLDQSTVSGNSTAGDCAYGGGIFADGAVTLTQSTVSGNSTAGN